ncbi:MAG: hypothetical protein U0175_36695 [Caldilineaceae bacterium]
MQTILLDQQIQQKLLWLTPEQKQTIYDFINFLLSTKSTRPELKKSDLLTISVWSEEDIQEIEKVQKQINAWTLAA